MSKHRSDDEAPAEDRPLATAAAESGDGHEVRAGATPGSDGAGAEDSGEDERRTDRTGDEPPENGHAGAEREDTDAVGDPGETGDAVDGGTTAAAATTDGATDGGADERTPPRRGGRMLGTLALLLALAALGAAGWLGWRVIELEQRMAGLPDERAAALEPLAERTELQALEGRFERRLEQRADDLAADIAGRVAREREQALAEQRERLTTLERGVEQVRDLAARQQVEWRLAEIRYLLSIAQRRLLIARDDASAIAALEAADQAIGQLGNVRLLPLRQRIVDDITALRAVEPPDIEGTALRLQNLLGRVSALPPAGRTGADAEGTTAGPDDGSWWQRIARRLDDYVSVERRPAAPAPGRPQPRTDLPVADELVLALERAREAALAHNEAAYTAALERARALLDSGFDGNASATAQFRAALDELQARPVTSELPDLDPTLALAERLSARLTAERARATAAGDPDGDAAPADSAAPSAPNGGN